MTRPTPEEPLHPPRLPASSRRWLASPPAAVALRVLLVLALASITWLAWSPDPPAAIDTGWDKANHGLAFALLALNAMAAFRGRRRRTAACAAALLAYGALIEAVQQHLPGRSAEAADLVADAVGIAAGLWLARWLRI